MNPDFSEFQAYIYLIVFCVVYVIIMVAFNVKMSLEGLGALEMGKLAKNVGNFKPLEKKSHKILILLHLRHVSN